jgi:uncharacterized membrane protein (DUF2068 family)
LHKIHSSKRGIHTIAIFEAFKGLLGLTVGIGLFSLRHKDLQDAAENLVEVLHFHPTGLYAQKFIEKAGHLNSSNLKLFIFIAAIYATIRFVEAYGLWRLRAWAQWFAIISGGLYIPVEIYEIFQKPTLTRVLILLVNIGVVLYLIYFRREQLHDKAEH